jgi:membrane-associated phospholipid phosphatase
MKYIKYFGCAALLFLFSCQKDIPSGWDLQVYDFSTQDALGGTWKPILLERADQISLPAPAAIQSSGYQSELADVRDAARNLTPKQAEAIQFWGNNGLLRWNEIARELVSKYNLVPGPNSDGTYSTPNPGDPAAYPQFPFAHPPFTARMFAYWSAAQFDALIATWHYKERYNRPAPYQVDAEIRTHLPVSNRPSWPSEAAVVATVSEAVLGAMFPLEKDYLRQKALEHRNTALWSGLSVWSDVTAGDSLGRGVAALFLARAAADGMNNAQGSLAVSDSLAAAAQQRFGWHWENLENPRRPTGLVPQYGKLRTWYLPGVESTRPAPPPAPGTTAFEEAAAELQRVANNLSLSQRRIANFWADGPGTYTPPGHWNRRAADLVLKYRLNPLRSARVFAYMNMAVMDGGISCWDTKYYYHYPRPSQLIPGFRTILGIPNFPGYTSGHSVFSSAAAEVLSFIFPLERQVLESLAMEAAESRIYGGIHFRFDSDIGLIQGRNVAAYAIAAAQADGG